LLQEQKFIAIKNHKDFKVFFGFVRWLEKHEEYIVGNDPESLVSDFLNYKAQCQGRKKLKLMTIHKSKGLEFPHVFLVGLTQDKFPNTKHPDFDIEEERRMCFVAITRAKEKLYLTGEKRRSVFVGDILSNKSLIKNKSLEAVDIGKDTKLYLPYSHMDKAFHAQQMYHR